MSSSDAPSADAAFLSAGGETGALIAQFDWAATALGPIGAWSESLRMATLILLDSPLAMVLLWGRDGVLIYNDSHARLTGLPHSRALGASVRDVWPEHAGLADQILDTGLAGRPLSLRNHECRIDRLGQQEQAWFDLDCSPVRNATGEPAGVLVVSVETTQRVLAEREAAHKLKKREVEVSDHLRAERTAKDNAHLSAALAIARLGTFEWDYATQSFSFDARAREILGLGPAERVTFEELNARIDPQDQIRIHAVSAAADVAGQSRREYEYSAHLADGSVHRVAVVTDLALAQDGRRFTGVLEDITERRAADRRQRLLINELNHRVKNTLATVQSIAAQTLHAAPNVGAAQEHFESRLMALSAAHNLLTARGWHGAALADIAATAMRPFEGPRPQIRRSGPHVELPPEKTLAFNLALHELSANAAKYGALSTTGGRVDVTWTIRQDELTLRWIEQGGPPVAAQAHAGFGARLLQRSLARELGGAVDWIFAPQGVQCEIRCQIKQVVPTSPLDVAEAFGRGFDP